MRHQGMDGSGQVSAERGRGSDRQHRGSPETQLRRAAESKLGLFGGYFQKTTESSPRSRYTPAHAHVSTHTHAHTHTRHAATRVQPFGLR